MPKIKTNRGAAKRFKLTSKGKVRHKKINRNHILNHKTTKRKRKLRKGGLVDGADMRSIRRLLPNG